MEELAVRNNVANKSEIKQYIVIRINNEFFGIDIMNVDSIVKIQQITRVPKSQDYFIGVINLRGEIVPVGCLLLMLLSDCRAGSLFLF